ncbi:OmpA family protein [Limnohabitans sp.]|uniref:OmpA family protein n=1 Tax=Limnohabitans sp. TaxID=1907725 RepID=UPI0038BB73C6
MSALACGLTALSHGAIAEPDTQRIIDALKPPAADATAPTYRTRSLRNLRIDQVDAAPVETQAASHEPKAAPSISLTIGFEFNSSAITAESLQTLNNLSKALQSSELQSLSFRIEGHTDAKGKPDYNQKLSQLRANAVKAQLEKLGVAAPRLVAQGKGDSEPANSDDKFAAENRRVKIVTLTP